MYVIKGVVGALGWTKQNREAGSKKTETGSTRKGERRKRKGNLNQVQMLRIMPHQRDMCCLGTWRHIAYMLFNQVVFSLSFLSPLLTFLLYDNSPIKMILLLILVFSCIPYVTCPLSRISILLSFKFIYCILFQKNISISDISNLCNTSTSLSFTK